MLKEDILDTHKEKLKSSIRLIKKQYEKVNEQSVNIVSYYEFNRELDTLYEFIKDMLIIKARIIRMEQANKYHNDSLNYQKTDEYQNQERYKWMLEDKKIILDQIAEIDKIMFELNKNDFLYRVVNHLEMEKFNLGTDLQEINSILRVYESSPDLTDKELDIYITNSHDNIAFRGQIYLHNTQIEIGNIEYRGSVKNEWLGDIGYTISRKYRGNNYAYKALKLITPLIASKGINKVTITADENNIASIKTIEKFGGIPSDKSQHRIIRYTCYIAPTLEQSIKISQ